MIKDMSEKTELLKLLFMNDEELIQIFQTNNVSFIPGEFYYRWKKRLSIYSPTNTILHDYKWLAEALRCHGKEEILLLRSEIEALLNMNENVNINNINNNNIKKTQSCPHSLYLNLNDTIEKTINSC